MCEKKLRGEDSLSCLPSRTGRLSCKITLEEIRTKCLAVEWIQFILVCPTVPSISKHSPMRNWLSKRDRLIPRDYEGLYFMHVLHKLYWNLRSYLFLVFITKRIWMKVPSYFFISEPYCKWDDMLRRGVNSLRRECFKSTICGLVWAASIKNI